MYGQSGVENMVNLREFYKNKRVLITGHTGFKGSWLTFWLHEMDAEVCGYALEEMCIRDREDFTVDLDKYRWDGKEAVVDF